MKRYEDRYSDGMQYLVRTSLAACSLLALPSVVNAEPGTETAVRDTYLNANCPLTDYGASGDLFIGKSGEWFGDPACAPGDGVTATNRQLPMVMFDLTPWIPGSLTNVVFDIHQEEFTIAVESASVCTSSEELIEGALWDDEPICDNPRATRGSAAHYYLQNPLGAGLPLVQGSTLAKGALFEADMALSMGNGSGLVTLSIYPSFSNEIPETDHYASLESSGGIFPTLTFDGVLKECNVDAECSDGDVCTGVETCVDYLCVDGTDAPPDTVCPGGTCQAGVCTPDPSSSLPQVYLDLGVCGSPGSEAYEDCEGYNLACPCGTVEYGGGHWWNGRKAFWECGVDYTNARAAAGDPVLESVRIPMRNGYFYFQSINEACWELVTP